MRSLQLLLVSASLLGGCKGEPPQAAPKGEAPRAAASVAMPSSNVGSIHALTMKRLDGSVAPLASFQGKVLLVVNTASECGYTPQYERLQAVHAKYEARGFSVIGFPSNDFGGQEPGTTQEIATFCKTRFGVTFPMFEKVRTVGEGRSDLYAILSDAKGAPKWNFHKYLIDKSGRPVAAFSSAVTPDASEITRAIEAQL